MSSYVSGYMQYGDEIEEFCLPVFAYLIYTIIKYIINKDLVPKRAFFISGVFVGLIFWSKYTILTPYAMLVSYFVYLCMRRKDKQNMKNMTLYSCLGISLVTAAVFVYFFATDSFAGMIDVYFKENLGLEHEAREMFSFFVTRFFTMLIEVGGVYFALNVLGQTKLAGKIEIQFVVVSMNYALSKFVVFKNEERKQSDEV